MRNDGSHSERRTVDLSKNGHSVDRLDGERAVSCLNIICIKVCLLNLNIATPDVVEIAHKFLTVVPDVTSVGDVIRSPELYGIAVIGIVFWVDKVDLELTSVGTLNSDVELLLHIFRVDLKNLHFFASVMVASSLFFGSFILH